jgi:hypothetical protein
MLMNRMRTEGAHDGPYLMMATGNNTMINQSISQSINMALYEDSSLLCQDPEDEGTAVI